MDPSLRNFSEEEAIRGVFAQLDKDNSGTLSKVELVAAIREHKLPALQEIFHFPDHVKQEDGSRDDFVHLFHDIDDNGDGSITLQELISYYYTKSASRRQGSTAQISDAIVEVQQTAMHSQSDFNNRARRVAEEIETPQNSGNSICASAQGFFAILGEDGSLTVTNFKSHKKIRSSIVSKGAKDSPKIFPLATHVEFSPDGNIIALWGERYFQMANFDRSMSIVPLELELDFRNPIEVNAELISLYILAFRHILLRSQCLCRFISFSTV
jgi:Ca2+-binding EF-hand superfamily protein